MAVFQKTLKTHKPKVKKDIEEVLKNIIQGKKNAEEFYKLCQIRREDLEKRVTI